MAHSALHRQEMAKQEFELDPNSRGLFLSLSVTWQPWHQPQSPLCVNWSKVPLLKTRCGQLPENHLFFFFFQKIILIIIKINVIKGIVVGGSPDTGGQEPPLPSTLSDGLIASSFTSPVSCHLPTWARHVLLQGRAGGALKQLLFRLSETVESFQHSR